MARSSLEQRVADRFLEEEESMCRDPVILTFAGVGIVLLFVNGIMLTRIGVRRMKRGLQQMRDSRR